MRPLHTDSNRDSTNSDTRSVGSKRSDEGGEFSRLLVANRHRIYGFIYALVHDHSATDDILQEATTVLWKKFDKFEPGTDFGAWAMSVARLSIFEWRRKQKKVPLPLDDRELMLLADEAVVVSCEADARHDALRHCVASLTDRQRELVRRRYQQGERVAQIAESSRKSSRAIYKILTQVHNALLKCIQKRISAEGRSEQPISIDALT